MKYLSSTLLLLALWTAFFNSPLLAQDDAYCDEEVCCEFPFQLPRKLYIGPEIYRICRTREGGSFQRGEIYGVRIGYDYIKRFKLYWGIDALYGNGTLRGRSGYDDKIKSTFTDKQIEGRLGYTIQLKKWLRPSFTPFVGYGYYQENNKFHHPSPLKLKFRTRYNCVVAGFLSHVDFNPHLTVGVNFRARFMHDAKCKVTDDPDEGDVTLSIKDKVNYRVEVPVSYRLCSYNDQLEFDVVPFYEFRHFGGRKNFPFNFLETRLRLYGVSLFLNFRI
jgi:hypothetical protein